MLLLLFLILVARLAAFIVLECTARLNICAMVGFIVLASALAVIVKNI
ncbi:MAG: hypothetical protein ACR5KW_03090 [Wolbachia sp.]